MTIYDWTVIGGGFAGSALSYELARQGSSVLLIEQDQELRGATRYTYGGIAYWSGKTALMQRLGQACQERYPQLADELGHAIDFRYLQLVLVVRPDEEMEAAQIPYRDCAIPPQPIGPAAACDLEPHLNPEAISGALVVKHGHVDADKLVQAYRQAFLAHGGQIDIVQATRLSTPNSSPLEVHTSKGSYQTHQVAICAGAFSRALLQSTSIRIPLYFTHAEIMETEPAELQLNTMIMPALTRRFALENQTSTAAQDPLWDEPGHKLAAPILDPGAIQFLDGRIRMGQLSRVLTDLEAEVDAISSSHQLRERVGACLPALANIPGTWARCRVAFCRDHLPLVGPLREYPQVHLFTGFSNPFTMVPPLAQEFTASVAGGLTALPKALSPSRFN